MWHVAFQLALLLISRQRFSGCHCIKEDDEDDDDDDDHCSQQSMMSHHSVVAVVVVVRDGSGSSTINSTVAATKQVHNNGHQSQWLSSLSSPCVAVASTLAYCTRGQAGIFWVARVFGIY